MTTEKEPYLHLVSVGGGLASTFELPRIVIDKYGAENVELIICALAGEHPDLWRTVAKAEELLGKHITKITYSPIRGYLVDAPEVMWWDIWDIFEQQGRMGSSLADPCSRILKRETFKKYIFDNHPKDKTVLHIGIGAYELDRRLSIVGNWGKAGYEVEFDLEAIRYAESIEARCQRLLGFVPQSYGLGFSHNNCGGFCVKAGHAQMAKFLWFFPETYGYHEQKESLFQARFNTNSTIMRDRKSTKGITQSIPLSLVEFRERMRAKWRLFPPTWQTPTTKPIQLSFGSWDNDQTPGCAWCGVA